MRVGCTRPDGPRTEDDMSRNGGSAGGQGADGATLDPRVLDDVVQRIVAVAQPERVILFGSAARGEMGRHSDVDPVMMGRGGMTAQATLGGRYAEGGRDAAGRRRSAAGSRSRRRTISPRVNGALVRNSRWVRFPRQAGRRAGSVSNRSIRARSKS